jgi:hypothetical protein
LEGDHADHPVEPVQMIARHGGEHVVLDVVVHLPVKKGSCGIFGGEKGAKNGRMEGWKNTIKPCVHTTERCWDWKKDGRLRAWI